MTTPAEQAHERGVTEIVHFTTDKGVLGSLRKEHLLSRARVSDDPDLAFIFNAVWPVKLPEWVDYISLSVTSINRELFNRAERNLPGRWWAVMSFEIEILDDPGVVFTTTNNAYDDVCRRQEGVDGFADMFSERVPWGYYGSVQHRATCLPAQPTHRQAEVLYPGEISLEHLQSVYVRDSEQRRMIRAWCSAFDREPPEIEIRPDVFT
jgi:hypothetical protein